MHQIGLEIFDGGIIPQKDCLVGYILKMTEKFIREGRHSNKFFVFHMDRTEIYAVPSALLDRENAEPSHRFLSGVSTRPMPIKPLAVALVLALKKMELLLEVQGQGFKFTDTEGDRYIHLVVETTRDQQLIPVRINDKGPHIKFTELDTGANGKLFYAFQDARGNFCRWRFMENTKQLVH